MKHFFKAILISTLLTTSFASFANNSNVNETYEIDFYTPNEVDYTPIERVRQGDNVVLVKNSHVNFSSSVNINYFTNKDGSIQKSVFLSFYIGEKDNLKIGQYDVINFFDDNTNKRIRVRNDKDSFTFHDSYSFRISDEVKHYEKKIENIIVIKENPYNNTYKVQGATIETMTDKDVGFFQSRRLAYVFDNGKIEYKDKNANEIIISKTYLEDRFSVHHENDQLLIKKKQGYENINIRFIVKNSRGYEDEINILLNEENPEHKISISDLNI